MRGVGWHHRLDGHALEEAPGAGDGQGSLACCSPWSRKESDMTERLNQTEVNSVTYEGTLPKMLNLNIMKPFDPNSSL